MEFTEAKLTSSFEVDQAGTLLVAIETLGNSFYVSLE